jgi:hypothetical protein
MRPSCGELLPMAIPTFGGMMAVVLTAPVVPVLYCAVEEWKLRVRLRSEEPDPVVQRSTSRRHVE